MKCEQCGKWAGAHATLPGQPTDDLCFCPPKPKQNDKKDFSKWWDGDEMTPDNPYRVDSPAYWAWEGWQAGSKNEREWCAHLCSATAPGRDAEAIEEAILARGKT